MSLQSLASTARRLGVFDPIRTSVLGAAALVWGPSIATAYAAAAGRHPLRSAIVDDHGRLTYLDLERRSTRIAAALRARGLRAGSPVGLLCRNHRGFVEANLALAKIGARVVYLNPALPPAQLRAVAEREALQLVVVDRDLADRVAGVVPAQLVVVDPAVDPAWSFPGLPRNQWLIQPPRTLASDDPVVLTSGTTGAPKGTTRRPDAGAALGALGVLEAIPYERGEVMVIAAPLFHAWGLSQLLVAATMADTVVLRSRFDPAATLSDIEALGAQVLVAVPVMLRRMLDVARARDAAVADLAGLRITASSGSAMPGVLATEWMELAGPTLFSLYGSTEVGQVSLATPDHLRVDPSSAGAPLRGVEVRVLDDDGRPVPAGRVGRLAIASAMHMDGYTDGGSKEMAGAHMLIGDLGRLTEDGELFVLGRADDMIISGGENLFPAVIERALLAIDDVVEVAVVGVDDDRFGQRVRAVVVLADGPPRTAAAERRRVTALQAGVADELAPHEVPREFVFVAELPRNAAGKVLRRQLTDAITC